MRWNAISLAAVVAIALFIAVFGTGVSVVHEPTSTGSTTISILPPLSFPHLSLPSLGPTTATTSPTTPKKTTPASTPVVVPPTTPPAPVVSQADLAAASASLRDALVNIICIVPSQSSYESISGSGVIISPNGMILTNAHVAQYFLLANQGVSCVIRTGSPAVDTYHADLAYISPEWIDANPDVINETSPTGTGQYDFAILAIDQGVENTPLPSSFPYVPLDRTPPTVDEQVVIGAYPAQFLQTSQIESSLNATLVYGSIKNVYTFTSTTVDVVSLGGSAAAQEGSSGGGVVDGNGGLAATISTTTTEPDTAERDLSAITASYVRREYRDETGYTLDSLLAESPETAIQDFAPQIPQLEAIISPGSGQ